MRIPATAERALGKMSKKFIAFCEKPLIKHIVGPIVVVLPPALVTLTVSKETIKTEMVRLLGPNIGTFLNESALILYIGAFIYLQFLKALYALMEERSKPRRELDRNDLVALMGAIGVVVDDKANRFIRAVKKAITGNPTFSSDETIFQEITQPEQQIGLLVTGIRTIFEQSIDQKNTAFHVGLVTVSNGRPVDWAFYVPPTPGPRIHASDLDHSESTVFHCIKKRRTILIEDVIKEARKPPGKRQYRDFGLEGNANGSLLCYPLIHSATESIEYVLTIYGDSKKSLEYKYRELYEWVIRHFSTRIMLEHSLLMLKERRYPKHSVKGDAT